MTKIAKVKPVKTCYEHIGGKLGSLLFESFLDKGWIGKEKSTDKHFFITPSGETAFQKMGIDLSKIKPEPAG